MSISISTSCLHARETTAEVQIHNARSLAGRTPGGQIRRHCLDDDDFFASKNNLSPSLAGRAPGGHIRRQRLDEELS